MLDRPRVMRHRPWHRPDLRDLFLRLLARAVRPPFAGKYDHGP